jgi:hypothetical protein
MTHLECVFMGFFDFLLGNDKQTNVEIVPDHIWLTSAAKYAGIVNEVAERSRSEAVVILLVAHFPDVLAQLEEIADQIDSRIPVKAVLASHLNTDLAASLNLNDSVLIDIIVGERHPLASVDDRLEAFSNELPCRCRLSHHLSLDDPLIKHFAGEWVKGVLSKLGMSEGEAIESHIVSRRIRGMQEKIDKKKLGNTDAESAALWLERNCPEMVK